MYSSIMETTTFHTLATSSSSASSSSSVGNPWMDARIWSKLQHRLVDRVLAFLPPPAFFRARCVCKRWYSLLFSDSFLEMHLSLSPRLHWFIFFKQKDMACYPPHNKTININATANANIVMGTNAGIQGYVFDPQENSWYCFSFNLIPPGFSPTCSSNGLLCWASDEAGPKTLVLCNPLSKTLAQLPMTPRPRLYPTVGLHVGPASLDAAVAGDDLISPLNVKNQTAESFHADGNGYYSVWATISALPRLCNLASGRMVYVDGKFYCMNYNPFNVLSYDISSNTWCEIQAPMHRDLRSPSLVECRGRLVLVAAVEKGKINVPRSVRVWGLKGCGRKWVGMEQMPQQLYLQFADAEAGRGFECVSNGDFIVLTIYSSNMILLFDFYRKVWNWIAPCPFLDRGGGAAEILHAFAYVPRLATPALGLLDPSSLPFHSFNA